MQVGVDVKCMHTNFGGHGLSGFGDNASFKFGQISLSDIVRILNQIELAQKFMQVGVDVKCMHINFVEHGFSCFGDKISFQIWPSFILGH